MGRSIFTTVVDEEDLTIWMIKSWSSGLLPDSTVLRNVGMLPHHYKVSQSRGQRFACI